jgi:hypothetical protein
LPSLCCSSAIVAKSLAKSSEESVLCFFITTAVADKMGFPFARACAEIQTNRS